MSRYFIKKKMPKGKKDKLSAKETLLLENWLGIVLDIGEPSKMKKSR